MNHRIFVAFLLNFALAGGLTAQDPSLDSGGVLIPEQACFDVLHYNLELTVDPAPERRRIDGCLTMTAKMTAEAPVIALHLDSVFEVSGVSLRTGEATWRHDQGLLTITGKKPFAAGRRIEVKIHYGGRPRVAKNPPWNGGFTWAKSKSGQPWIATSCQGQGADLWWPCKDHPSDKPDTMHLAIRVPEGLFCATNGVFTGATTKDGWKTYRWDVKNPISNYCVALNIGPYVRLSTKLKSIDGTTTIPIHFWVLPEDKERAERILPQFVDHLRWFEKTLGPYPFRNEKYGIVQTPHLGMEHQTIIAYGNRFMGLRGGYDWLHHHELAHEWWGNLVTCRDWKDMWIHEGFGTYMQAMYLEELRGRAAYDNELAKNRVRMVNKKAVAPRTSKSSNESYFASSSDSDIYFKGAWILHSLRWLIGDATFKQCLREFCYPTPAAAKATDGSQTRFVSTQDFIDLVNRKTGKDLGWFFELYLRQAELPRLESKIVAPGKLRLSWEAPEGFDFPMPVPLRIGKSTKRVAVPKGGVTIDVVEDDYAIDPEGKLFRKTWERKRLRRSAR